ncbi:hypothetical protein ACFXB3_02115 [Streptomyces sp. NPDC059447]|uniref:hypothetical protein n=1 Tax=Streptomyces sp. NPDC059447 TaxID=3346834 RepID=UPI0036777685
MNLATVLLTTGSVALVGGGRLALDIRGSASALARRAEANAELRRHARGDLGPAPQAASAGLFRSGGAVMALCGAVLTLGGVIELL